MYGGERRSLNYCFRLAEKEEEEAVFLFRLSNLRLSGGEQ